MKDFFYKKKVLITGHTGFKGTWLSKILVNLGADVIGFSLKPESDINLFEVSGVEINVKSIIGDIRNYSCLEKAFSDFQPEIVIHLAAQPLVRESYKDPRHTYETNVLGTVNTLECIRNNNCVKSFLNVTTDKVYHNKEWIWGYRESDQLNGFDPYSNSKSCSELITHSYKNSFFLNRDIAISTARAGNVIGGGDFAIDRIIPDCIRAAQNDSTIIVRNPNSIRPYQHVLEPLYAYLLIVYKQYSDISYSDCYNVGPDDCNCIDTGNLVSIFCEKWEQATNKKINWITKHDGGPHEANYLKLDCSKIKSVLGWNPRWNISEAIEKTIEWTKVYNERGNISKIMDKQIDEMFGG